MKKLLIGGLAFVGLLSSCCGSSTCVKDTGKVVDTVSVTAAEVVEVYSGVIPAASAEGMTMILSLRGDGTYSEILLAQVAGAAEDVTEGRFELRGDTLILMPNGELPMVRGLLGSEVIRLLDADGNLPEIPYELKLQK
ncbi:MAG: copper resistance protein NlpE N-terminal domain-containing protein [Porphyromonadaceae bacterium]|nr:copper resistance protein NlpE N-terminal domain-containing protein [Porphyromonadaceae bacterium]